MQEPAKQRPFNAFHRMPQYVAAIGIILVLAVTTLGSCFLLGPLPSKAVQDPTIRLDMVTTGTTYDGTTNVMTVGTVDPCLAVATANPTTHVHSTHLVIQNVEDLAGWLAFPSYPQRCL